MKKTILSNALPRMTNVADAPSFALDWVPLEAVPESLCDRQCINCEGRYIDPLAQENTSTPPEKADIHAHANSTRLQDNEVILTGNANAVQGYRHMRSDNVVINREQESATLSGNVTLREPNLLLQGDQRADLLQNRRSFYLRHPVRLPSGTYARHR